MEAAGLVTSRHEEAPADRGGPPRRLYRRTAQAAELLALQVRLSDKLALTGRAAVAGAKR
jgi:DNA-binding PadR family transcriptional regulator